MWEITALDSGGLLESHGEDGLLIGNGLGGDGTTMKPENLPGEAESNAGTALFGGEERDKHFVNDIA